MLALLATLGTVVFLGWQFLAEGKVDTTITLLVQYGDVALFGFTIDRVSTLIAFCRCVLRITR